MDLKINLRGLLGRDLILYNKLINNYYNRLADLNVTTNVYCDISINRIQLKNVKNCSVSIINKCHSSSTTSINVLLTALIDLKDEIDPSMRKRMEEKLGIDFNKSASELEEADFIQRCKVSSSINNTIRIEELIVDDCVSTLPLEILFYNTGSAESNCGMVEIMNSISNNESEEIENNIRYQLIKLLSFTNLDLITIVCLLITILFIVVICVVAVKTVLVYYNYTYFF